ncbi:MAG: glycosyltransferase family 4 protein [Candidatus Poribacteria bacterium]|nr:glycosyltransferase family 4 protein [Candidatus Poribacteria bacterium]
MLCRFQRRRKPMKSLLITNDFPPIVSGISTYFYQIWRHLAPERSIILAPKTAGDEAFDQNCRLRIWRRWLPIGESKWQKIAKTLILAAEVYCDVRCYDIRKLHCGQVLSSGLAGLVCKKLLGMPYAVYVYGSETIRFGGSRLFIALIQRILDEADEVIPNSEFTAQEFLQLAVRGDNFVKITPGVDTKEFAPAPKPQNLIDKYNLDGKSVLLTVSRLDERKGHAKVLEALPIILERFSDISYIIVGKGRELTNLQQVVKKLELEGHVHFAGFVPDEELVDYYNLCDIFVLPNKETEDHKELQGDYEGFGIVFLEAGACCKPVIAGRSGGVEDAVIDGKTGILVNPHAAKEIADAVTRLLEAPRWAEQIGKFARRRTETTFDWRIIAKSLERIL